MADMLLNLAGKSWVRGAVSTLGIPLPMPQALDRAEQPWEAQPLTGKKILVGGAADKLVAGIITDAGGAVGDADKIDALVFDARSCASVADLEAMYAFFHGHVRKLAASGRVLIVAAVPDPKASVEAAAASAAVTGFAKSCAKEIGKKGATANAIFMQAGAESLLAGPLRFFLSTRSAFVDGQTLTVTSAGSGATPWTRPLAGKTALVTGAARGIGEITARRLADEGAKLIVLDVPSAKADLEKLAAQLGGIPLTLDITAADAVGSIRKAAEQAGGLHIVVNNAGITRDKTIANMTADQWNLALNVNLKAALAITEGALPALGTDGRAIFLSSIAGIAGNFGQTNYGAAKSGLIGAIRHLAARFAAQGATVNGIAPGFIETQMTAAIPFVTREAGRRLSNLGQGGLPLDVAEAITFMASPGARGINGQVLRVCGGSYIGA